MLYSQETPSHHGDLRQSKFTLFDTEVAVKRSVPSCATKIFSLTVGYMFAILQISLSEAEIQQENFVRGLITPNTEVSGFDVPV